MDNQHEQPEMLQLLEQRIDVIQRKIAGLLEQQKQIEAEISYYRALYASIVESRK